MSSLVLAIALLVAGDLPAGARLYGPMLAATQAQLWPSHTMPETLAGQVEQETCASLSSTRCWNPRTELKTSREYGFGLGQLTVTSRFNAFEEMRAADPVLRGWSWENRYDPALQLRALVLKDRQSYDRLLATATERDRLAMTYAAYNGGLGGVLSDRRICSGTRGCDPGRWFDHVERTSLKARTVAAGYGQSFFDVNRGYVRNVMLVRSAKYAILFRPGARS